MDAEPQKPIALSDESKNGLCVLLESLREEIEQWVLEAPESSDAPLPAEPETIRYGLYQIALDVLLCEAVADYGFSHFKTLHNNGLIPHAQYEAFSMQLGPYVKWLRSLNMGGALTGAYTDGPETASEANAASLAALEDPVVQDWLRQIRP